ncbi:1408_t:CDS:2 [Acaulospora colombiana]|uniref:1408_t:CDS:1 n=1 Tax=Acaulospora colombiana TaxID=27376 RepID=A0ACA9L3B3_9GLOM|nr:1408_t:CDS:2 [Acaulospora colombiana]
MANGEKRLMPEDRMEKRKVNKRRQTGTAKDDIELFQSPPSSPRLAPKSSHLTSSLEAPSQLQTPFSSPPTSRPPSPNPVDTPLSSARLSTSLSKESSYNVAVITIVTRNHILLNGDFVAHESPQQNIKIISPSSHVNIISSSVPPCITNSYLTKLLSPFFNCIRTLNLAGGSRSDACLSSIIPHCHQIQHLSLAWNTSLSDASINKIASVCGKGLRTLDLTNCEKVSDRSMNSIAQYCVKLRELRVSYCRGVSEVGVESVVEGCEELKLLDLVGCLSVDRGFLLKCNDDLDLVRRDLKVVWRRVTEGSPAWVEDG